MKEPKCKICGKTGHYQSFCFQKKKDPIPTYSTIKISTKPKQRVVIKAKSESERSKAIREADRLFSIFVRRKDSQAGIARCVTCGKLDHYKNMDAGHYISRRFMAVRYHPDNVHVQCRTCNRELGGNLEKYKAFMINKYGEAKTERLRILAQRGGKLSMTDLQAIQEKYRNFA